MRAGGWEIWLSPKAEVVHLGGVSIRQVQTRWIISSHRGMYRYFRSRRPRFARPLIAVAIAARAAVKLIGSKVEVTGYEQGHQERKYSKPDE
jgi:GT2 family glycosyltransferase